MMFHLGYSEIYVYLRTQLGNAAVAQSVEHQLPKLRVAGSSPVCRSQRSSDSNRCRSFSVLSLAFVGLSYVNL